MNKLIRSLASVLCLVLPITIHAQINRHLPGSWNDKPVAPVADPSLFRDDFTMISHNLVYNFVLSAAEEESGATFARYVHRRIRVNTQKGSDSLTHIILPLRPTEAISFMRARIVQPDGSSLQLSGQLEYMGTAKEPKAVLSIPPVPVGGELEYETEGLVKNDFAGAEYFQWEYPTLETHFKIIYPKKYFIRTTSRNGYPQATSYTKPEGNVLEVKTGIIQAKKVTSNSYYMPQLAGIEFSLYKFIADTDKRKNDTLQYNWNNYGEEQFVGYFYLDKTEFARLQKEMDTWAFLKQQKPLPLMIYQIEHFIKHKYKLNNWGNPNEIYDLSSILRTQRTNEAGLARLMAAVFYIMRIRCQLMLVNDRDQYPLDSNIVKPGAASNILLYFPDLHQALAPTEVNYQLPYYPPAWAGIPALVASDTLVDGITRVKTHFANTPMPDYTSNGMRNETEIWVSDTATRATLQGYQEFAGYADAQIKMALQAMTIDPKTTYNGVLLLKPDRNDIIDVKAENVEWSPVRANAPFTLRGKYTMPDFARASGRELRVATGSLLAYQYSPIKRLAPSQETIDLPYPCYFEKKVIVHLPKGYRLKNKNEFNIDLSNIDPLVGLRVNAREDAGTVVLFMTEWYKQPLLQGASRAAYDRMQAVIENLEKTDLVLEK